VSVHAVLTGVVDTDMPRGPRHTEGLPGVRRAAFSAEWRKELAAAAEMDLIRRLEMLTVLVNS